MKLHTKNIGNEQLESGANRNATKKIHRRARVHKCQPTYSNELIEPSSKHGAELCAIMTNNSNNVVSVRY